MAEIEPLVREAKEAVSNIKSEALTEIRYRELTLCYSATHDSSLCENSRERKANVIFSFISRIKTP